ncbi:pyridoxamine 5'-phosphate oxidase family protein [bacterium]|nr:pyridoxamine 5'-phosphate oxidase family protein [bacterium]
MIKTVNFLKEAGIFFISTINGDKPEVRPFGAINIYNDRLYFITSNTKDVYKQMVKNPNIQISAVKNNGSWIRLRGQVVFDESYDAKKSMLDNNPNLRMMYNESDNKMVVFYLANAKATIESFTSPKEEELF